MAAPANPACYRELSLALSVHDWATYIAKRSNPSSLLCKNVSLAFQTPNETSTCHLPGIPDQVECPFRAGSVLIQFPSRLDLCNLLHN